MQTENLLNMLIKKNHLSLREMADSVADSKMRLKRTDWRKQELECGQFMKMKCRQDLEALKPAIRRFIVNTKTLFKTQSTAAYFDEILAMISSLMHQNVSAEGPCESLQDVIFRKIAAITANHMEHLIASTEVHPKPVDCPQLPCQDKFPIAGFVPEKLKSFREETSNANFDLDFGNADQSGGFAFDEDEVLLTRSQLNFDGVDCADIFDKVNRYRELQAQRLAMKAAASAARRAANDEARARKLSALAKLAAKLAAMGCFPNLKEKKQWEVEWAQKLEQN